MKKSTIFIVFLAIVVLSIVFELGVEGKETSGDFLANVLVEDTYGEKEFKNDPIEEPEVLVSQIEEEKQENSEQKTEEPEVTEELEAPNEQAGQQEAVHPAAELIGVSNTELLIKDLNPGFIFEPEVFSGKVFQLLDISEISLDFSAQGSLKNNGQMEAVIYELHALDEVMAAELYQLIKRKTIVYSDISINETNNYGDGSFYINHVRKPDEVFLTVRIKNKVYAFAYSKQFHENIIKLISLLTFTEM